MIAKPCSVIAYVAKKEKYISNIHSMKLLVIDSTMAQWVHKYFKSRLLFFPKNTTNFPIKLRKYTGFPHLLEEGKISAFEEVIIKLKVTFSGL